MVCYMKVQYYIQYQLIIVANHENHEKMTHL